MNEQEELITYLKQEGYYNIREVPGRGLCGLRNFMFTIGLCQHLTKDSYNGRWCYPKEMILDSIVALEKWDGINDPMGEWIKFKGETEYSNPRQKWWGYKHTSGTYQAKRYFEPLDIQEARQSPFCEIVVGPFLALDRDEAINIVKTRTDD